MSFPRWYCMKKMYSKMLASMTLKLLHHIRCNILDFSRWIPYLQEEITHFQCSTSAVKIYFVQASQLSTIRIPVAYTLQSPKASKMRTSVHLIAFVRWRATSCYQSLSSGNWSKGKSARAASKRVYSVQRSMYTPGFDTQLISLNHTAHSHHPTSHLSAIAIELGTNDKWRRRMDP